jgi:hypothetical protein
VVPLSVKEYHSKDVVEPKLSDMCRDPYPGAPFKLVEREGGGHHIIGRSCGRPTSVPRHRKVTGYVVERFIGLIRDLIPEEWLAGE